MNSSLSLDDIENFGVAYRSTGSSDILSMDFHYNGEFFVFNREKEITVLRLDDQIRPYKVSLNSKDFTAGLCKFKDEKTIVHTSSNFYLRVLDVEDRHYELYMAGHTETVVSLCCATKFLVSSSQDKSVRFWDPQLQKQQHMLKFPTTPYIAIHPDEEVIVVLYESERFHVIEYYRHVKLSDPIEKKTFLKEGQVQWTGIKFSLDSLKLLITTNSSKIIVMDSLKVEILVVYKDYKNEKGLSLDACFSLDSKFVFGGSSDGLINVWDFQSPFASLRLNPGRKGPCRSVAFNPKFMNLATAASDYELQLWNDH